VNWLPMLRVTQRDLTAQIRSRSFLVQTLLLPLILTFIIGNALGGSRPPEPSPVVLVGERNRVSQALESVLTGSKLANVQYQSRATAEGLLRDGKVIVVVELPENPERALLRGREFEIRVAVDSASFFKGEVIQNLVQGFAQQLDISRATLLGAVRALKPETAGELSRLLTEVEAKVRADFAARAPVVEASTVQGRQAGFFTYYAIAFGVMFTLLSATHGAGSLVEEFERGTIARLLSAPLSPTGLLVGKFLALWAMAAFQLGSFVVLSSVLYGVRWGDPVGVTLTVLATAAAAAGFGGIIIGLASSHEQVTVLGLIFVLVMSLLGGSMYPVDALPGLAQQLSRLTYNRWSIEAFQLLSTGVGSALIVLDVLVLMSMALVGLGIGATRLSRRFAS
jgi:ABC-2 type transport system permease protein